jgi:tricorn protease
LYFFASTNTGPALSWLDISSFTNQNTTSSVYCVVLRNDLPNPLHPESDEDGPKPATPPAAEAPRTGIDIDQIEQRIITLPMPQGNYSGLEPGPAGSFFATLVPPSGAPQIMKWSMASRSATPFATGFGISTTPDGTKGLVSGAGYQIVSTMAPMAPPGPGVSLANMRVKIDPKAEWRSMFDEIFRNQPMLMYADNYHGLNAAEMRKRYEPFVDGVATRADLNYLFTDMIGEVSIGHMWASGGDLPSTPNVSVGLLGADYTYENGKYKIARVYDGERWNPGLYAPLAQPGLNIKAGEYILAIDGKDLVDSGDIYQMLEGKTGRQVKVKVGPSADGANSRELTVVPVGSESALRNKAWAEDNRRYVAKMTGGRAGYVHVPDTGGGGWESFMRYYYSQSDKDGMVVDERFNNGGYITDYMIYEMMKTLDGAFTPRDGKDWPTPGSTIYGPKVMLVNEFAGSGGDMFPWLFQHKKIGKVIGKRTWGGLVASFGFPIVDGGYINAPNCAFYNPASGKWEVEGYGIDPDVVVELDPYLWRQGKDSQLDAAIAEMNKQLAKYKRPELKRPANPDKSKVGSGGF